jgi:hypothetical protein
MLAVIRELELPLVLVFNRSRVMVLSQGVSKATGLQTALNMLRASPRNTVAVGDAENDHELLRLAEVSAAVAWGSASLKAAADYVVNGDGPADVATFIDSLEASGRLPVPARARRRLFVGRTPPELTAATEVILATRTSKPGEFEALRSHCAYCQHSGPSVSALLGQLDLGQAVALPITQETGGELRMFWLGRRLTPHVRHRQKYVDLPVAWDSAFVFGTNGSGAPVRARTLRQFVAALDCADVEHADGYLRRGDFSRWIADVFGDRVLADKLRAQKRRYVVGERDALKAITEAIRSRYDLTEENDGAP